MVPAKRLPFFKVGKELKLRVDGKPAPDTDDSGSPVAGGSDSEFQEG